MLRACQDPLIIQSWEKKKLVKNQTPLSCKHNSPCGASYAIQSIDPRFYREPVIITPDNSGKSVAERLLDAIIQDAEELRNMLAYKVETMPEQQDEFEAGNTCHICEYMNL